MLLYLTAQRQISKAIEIAGVSPESKEIAWVSFSEVPNELSVLIDSDDSLISKANFDYSLHGINDSDLNLDTKQKIIMTRTSSLPVQSR